MSGCASCWRSSGLPPTRRYGAVLRVPEDSESFSAARALVDKFANRQLKIDAQERKARVDRIANDAEGRKRFADTLDTTFLKAGRDATFKVSGAKNTTLEMVYILVNRPLVYQITNDGYGGSSWTYDAPEGLGPQLAVQCLLNTAFWIAQCRDDIFRDLPRSLLSFFLWLHPLVAAFNRPNNLKRGL